ncbi:MAG: BON domain-containing protein [Candidatus Binatia bacterium]
MAAKKRALELAAAVPGVSGIVDRLRVAPAQRMDNSILRDHVRDVLTQEPALQLCIIQTQDHGGVSPARGAAREPAGVITVAIEGGVVTLNGRVPSLSHKRLAGALAWWVPGSRDVINGLEVASPQEDNDDEITDAVRLVLEKDHLVDAGQIRVSTRRAVVTLEGLVVANEREKSLAESDAWYVFGVDRVVNALAMREGVGQERFTR